MLIDVIAPLCLLYENPTEPFAPVDVPPLQAAFGISVGQGLQYYVDSARAQGHQPSEPSPKSDPGAKNGCNN